MEIEQLQLTEKDFTLIVEALDYLPDRHAVSDIMGDLLGTMMAPDDEARKKIQQEKVIRELKNKAAKDALKEDIRILQGKLLMFKRYLIEHNALQQVEDILKR